MNAARTLAKLRTMSPSEVVARLAIRATEVRERFAAGRPQPHVSAFLRREYSFNRAPHAFDAAMLSSRRDTAPRVFASLKDLTATRSAFLRLFSDHVASARDLAEEICGGRITFFGRTFDVGDPIDWHADPSSRRQWPRQYRADIPTANGNLGFGDVKDVWELNRHQFVVDLAKAWVLTNERRYADAVYRIVDTWIADNPCGLGINWTGPLEPAYRGLSWLWAYYFCLNDPQFPSDLHTRWMASFRQHGAFLARHLELFASPYNHLIGEAAVLFLLGTTWPEFQEATMWREKGRRVLESRLREQFYDDGGTVEQATLYHHATLGFYCLAEVAAEQVGETLTGVPEALERAIEFAMHLTQPDGTLPMIGDTDDARPIRFEERPLWDFRHFQSMGAVLFGRADFKSRAGAWAEDAFWVLGPEAVDAFDAVAAAAPSAQAVLLRSSGYAVSRSAWTTDADYACFDCGEQAAGLRTDDVPSAAHGHADALSVVLALRGRPVLVDSGFFTYNGDSAWERCFRETGAHSTVRVDRRNQSVHLEKMAWSNAAGVAIEHWATEHDWTLAAAAHDGYARTESPVWHRRAVLTTSHGYAVVVDQLHGEGEHEAEVIFQCAPGVARLDGSRFALHDGMSIQWAATLPLHTAAATGGDQPCDGWIAPGLGRRHPAPRLVLSGRFDRSLCVMTVVSDERRARAVVLPDSLGWSVEGERFDHTTACAISGRGSLELRIDGMATGPIRLALDAPSQTFAARERRP